MGAVYSVQLKMYVEDEQGAVETLQNYVENKGADAHTDFSLEDHADEGVYPDNLDDLIKIFLAGWASTPFNKKVDGDGMLTYTNDFDASYGWEGVMQDMFELLIPYISDISTLMIEPDNNGYTLGIENGEMTTIDSWTI